MVPMIFLDYQLLRVVFFLRQYSIHVLKHYSIHHMQPFERKRKQIDSIHRQDEISLFTQINPK